MQRTHRHAVPVLLLLLIAQALARPVVRSIRSAHEFDRLLKKHATETGLPVVVDFYSDSCGPCRMMAPIFKKVAKEFKDTAVFVKVDTNAQYELSGRYQIRSLPTFQWFVGGKKWDEAKGGIGEGPLRQKTQSVVTQAETENIRLELDDLVAFYGDVDASKERGDIESLYNKCAGMKGSGGDCVGGPAFNLVRKLKRKYKKAPTTQKRFVATESGDNASSAKEEKKASGSSNQSNNGGGRRGRKTAETKPVANLHLASKDELMTELEKRLDEERDAQVEMETDDADEAEIDQHRWMPSSFPERVIVVGGGPAGMSAAIYAARAGLAPLVIAPSMGGQLQGKGVDVENYPGLNNVTGPSIIAHMRAQAASFGAVFEEDLVTMVDASTRPLLVHTNATGGIPTHSIIVATGAESNWLGIPGEYELRGGGVSSCATCDGFLFAGQHVVVVGGGDSAMEDALVLARTSKTVTVVHRRDTFRASKILADRVINHPTINIVWNATVKEILGKAVNDGDDTQDLDNTPMVVAGVKIQDTQTKEIRKISADAVFVAIGHTPSTSFLEGVVEFNPDHKGYIQTYAESTKTSVAGIFAAGDVTDAIYRQAITSAGSGAAAALDAERWLSEEGLGNEEAEMEAELLAELMGDAPDPAESLGYNAYADAGGRMQGMKESVAAEL